MEMQTKFIPFLEYISKPREATAKEVKQDKRLSVYMKDKMRIEGPEETMRRNLVMKEISKIFEHFVQDVGVRICQMSEEEAERAGGELRISGSHRLGVRDIGADIDTICVAPNFVTRDHFFSILKGTLLKHDKITELKSIETATVPLMEFEFEGIAIDLLFAPLATNVVKRDFDILNDSVLVGLDIASEMSLNGPRVTNMIMPLANRAKDEHGIIIEHNAFPDTFLIVLRCVRKWAKVKGLYGNKLGYLGGVNCNLLVTMVCQLFPGSSPSTLLRLFFQTYAGWSWPKPVQLNAIQPNPPGATREVWDPIVKARDLMPIITPAYPAMNSAASVTEHTRAVMVREFQDGFSVCTAISKDLTLSYDKLFEPSDFFIRYNHYLSLNVVGTNDKQASKSWMDFVGVFVKSFPQHMRALPITNPIHFFPQPSKTTKSANSLCYFIGFSVDKQRYSKELCFDTCEARFKEFIVMKYETKVGPLADGLDFFVEYHPWKKLPKEVFAPLNCESLDEAKKLREERGYGKYAERAAAAAAAAEKALEAGETNADGSAVVSENGEEKDSDGNMIVVKSEADILAQQVADKKLADEAAEEAARNNRKRKLENGFGVVVDPYVSQREEVMTREIDRRPTSLLWQAQSHAQGGVGGIGVGMGMGKGVNAHPVEVTWALMGDR